MPSGDLVTLYAPMLRAVGDAIAAKRRAKRLTQQELADRCGFQRAYLSALEHGQRNPTLITMARIAKELDWSLGAMLRSARPL